jgi:hypothetical protein
MKVAKIVLLLCYSQVFLLAAALNAQQAATSSTPAVVPQLVNFSGKATDVQGKPIAGIAGITFSIYKVQHEGAPLWMETQNVQADAKGNYTVQLGATSSTGLPLDVFTSGEARWLAVRVNNGEEQPRVLLLSVPYALKAADAETIGGLPPSAFVLAAPSVGTSSMTSNSAPDSAGPSPSFSGTGTTDYIPLWTNSTTLGNSVLFQSGSGTTAKVGINTATPASTLDIKGGETVRGLLSLPALAAATSTAGQNSQPFDFTASVYNSSTKGAVNQIFQWQAEPTGNDTASPSGSLNLLFTSGTGKPAETGFHITSNGRITFASGQTFPIAAGGVTNTELQNSSLTVRAGTDLTGGGLVALGGTTTLNLDTTKVPQLAAANVFTNQNTIQVNTSGTNCNGPTDCNPGLSVVNTGSGNGIAVTTTASQAIGLTINSGTGGVYVTSGFDGGIFEGDGGGGIYGDEQVDEDFLAGVNGYQIASPATHATIGVWGSSQSPNGFGVYGNQVLGNESGFQRPAGIWGDSSASAGVVGTSDSDDAVVGLTADTNHNQRAGFFDNTSSEAGDVVLQAEGFNVGGLCMITTGGDLYCSGSKSAVVPVAGGSRKVALYAVESPDNWFEDAGSGQLSSGMSVVDLESTFAETVNTNLDYRVFLTPNGDCKGLYVAQKSPTSFIVRELGGGTSNIAFDYRIMAKRKGYENVHLEDKTAVFHISETPAGLTKAQAHQVKTPPTPQQVRERLLKRMGVRPVAELSKPATGPVGKR